MILILIREALGRWLIVALVLKQSAERRPKWSIPLLTARWRRLAATSTIPRRRRRSVAARPAARTATPIAAYSRARG